METRTLELLEKERRKQRLLADPGISEKATQHHLHKLNKRILALAIGVITVIIMAVVVILSVYLGANTTRNENKEFWQIFRMDSGEFVEERMVVTDTEVHIKVFNEVEIVYDFTNGLVVERFVDAGTKVKTACFVRPFNESEAPRRDAKQYTDTGEIKLRNSSEPVQSEAEQWVYTDVALTRETNISMIVGKMCRGTRIYWMKRLDGDD